MSEKTGETPCETRGHVRVNGVKNGRIAPYGDFLQSPFLKPLYL